MKVRLKDGLEIECTPEEFERLYNSGVIDKISIEKSPVKDSDEANWDQLIQKKYPQDMYGPKKRNPWADQIVTAYGCYMADGTSMDVPQNTAYTGLSPEQMARLNAITGVTDKAEDDKET